MAEISVSINSLTTSKCATTCRCPCHATGRPPNPSGSVLRAADGHTPGPCPGRTHPRIRFKINGHAWDVVELPR